MPVEAADPGVALAKYLSTELTTVTGNVSTGLRIFSPKLPKSEQEYMPNPCVIVTPGGGGSLFSKDYLPMATPLMDFYCYGSTHLEADNLSRQVEVMLKRLTRVTYEEVCLCWARIAAQAKTMVDQDTLWPIALVTAQVQYFTTPT